MELPTVYQQYIHQSRYARWKDDEQRRETWNETVDRYINYFSDYLSGRGIPVRELGNIHDSILNLEVMPSMRMMWSAGKALERDNVAGYNCAYTAVDHPRVFDEILYILMCGTGVGYSVERQYVNKLPEVPEELHESETTIKVRDSKIGWASAYKELIASLYAGSIPQWDVSTVRPAGSILKTFGGRSSGPEPLVALFRFTINLFTQAAGRKLNSLEVHDLVCKIADIVVVGGVRRSALISLSNLSDPRMRDAKQGRFWEHNPQRRLANNSVCYTEKPDIEIFMEEWLSLIRSKSGERGVFNREAATKNIPERRKEKGYVDFGTNPCSEIILRSGQFCNLTEVVVRAEDTLDSLKEKVRVATILGTLQATQTNFRYLRPHWRRNTEEEALLGLSITGIMDHPILSGSHLSLEKNGFQDFDEQRDKMSKGMWADSLDWILQELKEVAIETNKEWSKKLGIEAATAITAVKPSGTVSQLVNSASGIHARHAQYYIRTVRNDAKDPLSQVLVEAGVPWEWDLSDTDDSGNLRHNTMVFSFPIKAPDDAVTRTDMSAIEQLELWKVYALHWCEHKPSVTITVKEDEWFKVGAWVYENFDICSGISFLPYDGGVYDQAPYQDIDSETFDELNSEMPQEINWVERLKVYENEDNVTVHPELACTANGCEI